MALSCPKCDDAALEAVTLDELEVERCPVCEGLWFNRGELAELLRRATQRVATIMEGEDELDHDAVPGKCPRDGRPLMTVPSARVRDIRIDSCLVCQGIWLDGGEFRRIKREQPGFSLGDLV